MPTITDIQPQRRRRDVFNLYIDDKFVCGLSDLDISLAGLHIGQEMEATRVVELVSQSQFAKAYNQSLNYLSYRARSSFEVADYLKRKDFDEATIEKVITKLTKAQLLDDMSFARSWITNRNVLKPRSVLMLRRELQQKRIAKDTIEAVLAEYDKDTELAIVTELIRKKQKTPRYTDAQKLTQYLLRQGFTYAQIKQGFELVVGENKSQRNSDKYQP